MFRRYVFPILASAVIIVSTGILAWAQTGELRGHATLKQSDGTIAPAADVVIDVYRVDIPAKFTTKTSKKGQFVYAGLPYTGDYVIVASAPGAQPSWQPGVKVGRDVDYLIELLPGDGKRLTIEEVKTLMASPTGAATGGGSRESADAKAKRAELEKKNAEIAASNEKVLKSNETVARTYKAGNEAFLAKNYDEAIKQYEEGLAADPEQPALLVNEARAYTARGVDRYNASITGANDAAKTSGFENAKSDFRSAATAASKAVAMIKAQPAPADPVALTKFNSNKLAALSVNAEAHRLFVSKADSTQADAGLAAFKDYIAAETDAAKKSKAQLDAAQMLLDAGAVDKSFNEYRAIVTAEPDNPDANLGAGLSLFATGDKTKYQDAANYLQHYVDVAPDTHKFKADAKAILAELKSTEKVVPTTTPTRRRGKP